jgi:hypothetical protein
MKKHLALLAVGAALVSAPAFANTDSEAKAQDYIQKADTNKDGQVSQSEHDAYASQDPATAQDFKAADADGDGNLTVAEVAQANSSNTGNPADADASDPDANANSNQ